MQHRRTNLFYLLMLVLVLLLPTFALTGQDLPTLTIAILDDPRGALSDGARLAVRQINESGGIQVDATTTILLEILPVTSTALDNPEGLVQALRNQEVIAVVGPVTEDQAINLIPVLVELGVPIITPATGDTLIATDNSGFVFRSRASDGEQGQALASFLIDQLGLTDIATAQLDIASTAKLLSFATAASVLGISITPAVYIADESELDSRVDQLLSADPEAIIVYGGASSAGALYTALQEGGWEGLFGYPNAADLTTALPADEVAGVIGATTWTYTFTDSLSVTFVNQFVRTYGSIPREIEAAGYDSIRLIAAALLLPDDLRSNLLALPTVRGVQGILNPSLLTMGETSSNVAITRLNEFGAPEVIAFYRDGSPIIPEESIPVINPTATLTPEPLGTFITILSALQNVRSGPSMDYPVIGQLQQGSIEPVIGRSIDGEWVVIEFNGDPGWLAIDLLSLTGDLASIPVIAPPVVPTPVITATPIPSAVADVIIQSAVINPAPIINGQAFSIAVTVANIGASTTGTFTVAGTLAPSNLFLSGLVPALAPGQTLVVNLSGILNSSGTFTSSIIIDANNQVNEGSVGEQNNIYNITYTVDRRVLRQASQTLNLGDTLDLEGNAAQGDINWNADGDLAIDGLFGSRLGILSGIDINAINYDAINPSIVNRESIPRTELFSGTLIGITTADGNRGVMRVDSVTDTQISLTFKVYSNS